LRGIQNKFAYFYCFLSEPTVAFFGSKATHSITLVIFDLYQSFSRQGIAKVNFASTLDLSKTFSL